MKKLFFVTIILSLLFTFYNCKKEKTEDETIPVENVTQYLREWGAWVYSNEEDLGKDQKNVSNDNKEYLEFGSKFTVILEKNINGKMYSKIQLPDRSEYWIKSDLLAIKFIVINKNDIACYEQPDNDYITLIKLQPGDFGIYQEEIDGWIKTDFLAYRPYKQDSKRKYVGERWIKEGYTSDLKSSKEAYYLYLAYYWNIVKNNKEKALEYLNKGINVNAGQETEISYVLKDYLKEIEGNISDSDMM